MPAAGRRIGSARLEVLEADITAFAADAIVNAANEHLQHGGGVAGAIARAGGAVIQEESDRIGFCATGSAVATSAGALPARWVVHAVGPRNGDAEREVKLASAARAALRVADGLGARSVAMPAISTGIYGYPVEEAAPVLVGEAAAFLAAGPARVARVAFCLRGEDVYRAFRDALLA